MQISKIAVTKNNNKQVQNTMDCNGCKKPAVFKAAQPLRLDTFKKAGK